jgi:predicted 3-demethylubiquinone-9 3-methyltransferase (glyoxalase superfamily)
MMMTPFVMFQGGVGIAAIEFWTSVVPDSRVETLDLFGPDGPGPEGTIKRAVFVIGRQRVMAHDSFIDHGFGFTPSHSFFLNCDDEPEIDRLFNELGEGGRILMPLGDYGWSRKFGWVEDRFGISWQLELES